METEFKKYFTILAKPTYGCNLKCPMCYLEYERETKKGVMSDEVLISLVSKAANINSQHTSIQWIGGESLLVGVDFYKKATQLIDYYSKSNSHITQFIQTNATLINNEWITFFKENKNIFLSISFEVTRDLQEKLRPMKKEESSYDMVKNNIEMLKENNISFGTLTVITKDTLEIDPKDWINHVIELGIRSIGLQICYQDFYWGDLEDTKKCMEWIDKLFAIQASYNQSVKSNDDYLKIRESYYLYNIMRNLSVCSCSCHNTTSTCSDYLLTVDIDGDVFGFCDAFMGTKDFNNNFLLGNILINDFSSILSSIKYYEIQKLMTTERSKCKNCDIYHLCNGGCPIFRSKNIQDGILIPSKNEDSYCEIQKSLFKYIVDIRKRYLLRSMYHFLEESQTLPNPLIYNI